MKWSLLHSGKYGTSVTLQVSPKALVIMGIAIVLFTVWPAANPLNYIKEKNESRKH